MATSRVQTLRSSTKGARPSVGARQPGELFVNFMDLALGVVDPTQTPVDLVAVRYFSSNSDYKIGDYVVQAGGLYRAKANMTAGSFNIVNWDAVITVSQLLAADGAGSGLDADLLDGQHGVFYLDLANATGVLPTDATHGVRGGGGLHSVATPSTAGFFSGSDKTKLDAIETGATGDQTPAEILTSIKTVDGAGSGLDADLLDGQHGAFYQDAGNINAGTIPAGHIDDAAHGNRGGGSLHALATSVAAGFFVDAAADSKQYVRKNSAWQEVVVPPNTYVGDTPPASPADGQMWFESDSGNTFIWYNDGNTRQWVQINAGAGTQGAIATDAPADGYSYARKNSNWDNDFFAAKLRSDGLVEGKNTGYSFNLYHDGTNWRRRVTGTAGLLDCSAAAAVEIFVAASGAADTIPTLFNTAQFKTTGITFSVAAVFSSTMNVAGTAIFGGPVSITNNYINVDARGVTAHALNATAGTNSAALLGYANAQTIYGYVGAFVASSGTWCYYGGNSSGYLVGGTWQTSSDERLKENFELIDPELSLAAVKAVPAYSFNWITDKFAQPEKPQPRIGGWKAQEMQGPLPLAITERSLSRDDVIARAVVKGMTKIPTTAKARQSLIDEPITALGMDLQTVVATLWAAVQALSAKVEELEAR